MKRIDLERYEQRAEILKALAHPGRLAAVDALAAGPLCVCELAELMGLDMSTASRHMAQLKAAGIVSDERRGTNVYYGLRCACLTDFFRCLESMARTRAVKEPVGARRR